MNRVYIANFGEGNILWPVAKANNTIITVDNVKLHPFWQAGDRGSYINAAMAGAITARGEKPSRQTAGRWYNLVSELQDTNGDTWISRQDGALWWTTSIPGELHEEVHTSTNPARDGPQVWRLQKPCCPWSDHDKQGRPIRWAALHSKAQDFLATEATFQSVANDRGYADYARALIAGENLELWHSQPLFRKKAATAKQQNGRLFSPRETSAIDMTRQLFATVGQSNGQVVERHIKEKNTSLSVAEWEQLLLRMLGLQQDRCALTALPLGYPGENDDLQMRPSLDRIDSSGHYTSDNVQIVCRFINRWKGADADVLARRLIAAMQSSDCSSA